MANFCSQCGKPLLQGADFCTHCGHSWSGKTAARPHLHAKRERVLATGSDPKRKRTIGVIVLVATVLTLILVYTNLPPGGNRALRAQPVVAAEALYPRTGQQMVEVSASVADGQISVPLALVQAQKFVSFSYRNARATVPLLAYISGEGKVVTAVSMCEPCNSQKFHIRGDELVCNSCGTKWKMNTMEPISGSCGKYPPDVVPNTIAGKDIIIDEQTVAAWQRRI